MKQIITKLSIFLALTYVFAMVFSSCSTSESVISNGFLQKRKYNKGFHKLGKSKIKIKKTEEKEVLVLTNTSHSEIKEANKLEINIAIKESKNEAKINYNQELVTEENSTENDFSNVESIKVNSELVETIESKVEKITFKLKNKSILNQTSNTSSTSDDTMMILLIILAVLLPFLAVGLYTDWDFKKFLICLLLCIFFWIPGIIYAFLVLFDKA